MSLLCLILSDDLLDASRIAGEGRSVGVDVVQCRDATALLAAAERRPVLAYWTFIIRDSILRQHLNR